MTTSTRGATRRVELRPLDPADTDLIDPWGDPGLAASWIADHDSRRQDWIVELDGAPVGRAGLHDVDRGHQRCGWTRRLAPSDAGLDACVHHWAFEYVFEGLRFAKLWCEAPAADTALLGRLETFGFAAEARLRGHAGHGDERIDVVRLGILAGDWRARRGAMAARLRVLGFEPPQIG